LAAVSHEGGTNHTGRTRHPVPRRGSSRRTRDTDAGRGARGRGNRSNSRPADRRGARPAPCRRKGTSRTDRPGSRSCDCLRREASAACTMSPAYKHSRPRSSTDACDAPTAPSNGL
jgi:hypothetical protein